MVMKSMAKMQSDVDAEIVAIEPPTLPDKATIPYDAIEPGVVALVRALNAFDGIVTIGSCEGHTPSREWLQPDGGWYVAFVLENLTTGWKSLERVGMVYPPFGSLVRLSALTAGVEGFGIDRLGFRLEGLNVNPDRVAQWLDIMRQMSDGMTWANANTWSPEIAALMQAFEHANT